MFELDLGLALRDAKIRGVVDLNGDWMLVFWHGFLQIESIYMIENLCISAIVTKAMMCKSTINWVEYDEIASCMVSGILYSIHGVVITSKNHKDGSQQYSGI